MAFINAPSKLLQILITSPVAFICVVSVRFVEMEQRLKKEPLSKELMLEAKRLEYPDRIIAQLSGKSLNEVMSVLP